MTIDEIRKAADARNIHAPEFWISGFDECLRYLGSLKNAEVWEFGKSAGGRPMVAVAYGEKVEPVGAQSTSYAAACCSEFSTFFGKQARTQQGWLVERPVPRQGPL